ncbi:MAG: hypothetical protein AAGI48_06290 [Verrucomicrobiota bacterium]
MSKPEKVPWKRKPHYYWWLLANTLAACLAILSWVWCLHVFGHPEIPRNYEILKKLGRADPPVGLALQEAPPGEAADPRALYRRYAELNGHALMRLNAALLRNYLKALDEPGLIQYVEGEFVITQARELAEGDLFHPGIAVRAQAMVQPDEFSEAAPWPVMIDYLFPSTDREAYQWFQPGDRMAVSKVPNCAMVLQVTRDDHGDTPVVRLVVVPIAMGDYQVGKERTFTISTPESLDLSAPFPVFPTESLPAEE